MGSCPPKAPKALDGSSMHQKTFILDEKCEIISLKSSTSEKMFQMLQIPKPGNYCLLLAGDHSWVVHNWCQWKAFGSGPGPQGGLCTSFPLARWTLHSSSPQGTLLQEQLTRSRWQAQIPSSCSCSLQPFFALFLVRSSSALSFSSTVYISSTSGKKQERGKYLEK